METELKSWTDEAQKYLEGYLQQIEALITAKDVDAEEVVNDLRTHILNLAAAQTGALVTVPELKRILATVGTPEDVADARAELGAEPEAEATWEAPYLNQPTPAPWKLPVWAWPVGAVVVLLFPFAIYLMMGKGAAPEQPVSGEVPGRLLQGWLQAGTNHTDYSTGYALTVDGISGGAMFIRSTAPAPEGFSTVMREVPADPFRGRRVTLSGSIRSEDVAGWAGMWLRIDGPGGEALGFDNMQDRPIKGTNPAQPFTISLDVPAEAAQVAYGVLLTGAGVVWFNEPKLAADGQAMAVPPPKAQTEAEAKPAAASSLDSYPDAFIKANSHDYFFARMANPEAGRHQFAGLWAVTRKAALADAAGREVIIGRALEIAQDPRNPFNQRFQCCYVASAFEDVRTIPYLEAILVNDANAKLRGVAACALGHFESPLADDALRRALANEPDAETQNWIRRALAGEFPRPALPEGDS
ncbi:MAG: HEAT repeat domain-containing protein [Candidatus Hydrogenedentes bacterium]|nr:HEAT repeat domain-containing protein [Candidatus Hydrogenedentota bacterium]